MSRTPPRLAKSLLARSLPDDDPLVGDLLEEFSNGRSHLWFWRQTASALLAASRRPRAGVRPLQLVAHPSRIDADPRPLWPRPTGGPLAYLSASPVSGIGSLGILAVIVLISLVTPQLWIAVAVSVVAGAALGVALVKRTAWRVDHELHPADRHVVLDTHAVPTQR